MLKFNYYIGTYLVSTHIKLYKIASMLIIDCNFIEHIILTSHSEMTMLFNNI